jgi:hypothetical protein
VEGHSSSAAPTPQASTPLSMYTCSSMLHTMRMRLTSSTSAGDDSRVSPLCGIHQPSDSLSDAPAHRPESAWAAEHTRREAAGMVRTIAEATHSPPLETSTASETTRACRRSTQARAPRESAARPTGAWCAYDGPLPRRGSRATLQVGAVPTEMSSSNPKPARGYSTEGKHVHVAVKLPIYHLTVSTRVVHPSVGFGGRRTTCWSAVGRRTTGSSQSRSPASDMRAGARGAGLPSSRRTAERSVVTVTARHSRSAGCCSLLSVSAKMACSWTVTRSRSGSNMMMISSQYRFRRSGKSFKPAIKGHNARTGR